MLNYFMKTFQIFEIWNPRWLLSSLTFEINFLARGHFLANIFGDLEGMQACYAYDQWKSESPLGYV